MEIVPLLEVFRDRFGEEVRVVRPGGASCFRASFMRVMSLVDPDSFLCKNRIGALCCPGVLNMFSFGKKISMSRGVVWGVSGDGSTLGSVPRPVWRGGAGGAKSFRPKHLIS